ncbi:MAG: tetratricopeptide repeat protein [Planctomycetaceae bacterium]
MRFSWHLRTVALRQLAGFSACSGLMFLSGCYNMNGYMLNASGQGYYEQGNYAMAAQEFQTALQSNPRSPDYMSNLAKARMKMGDQAGAEQLFRQALMMSPSHQPSYHGLAEMMLEQGRGQEAQQLLATWTATQPYVAESHVEMAWLQRELGQPDAAAQSLQTALQVNPNHSTALAHLGQYYQDTGQTAQAVTMYQQSLRANWNQPEVQSRLAVAAAAAGPNHPMSEMAMARGVHPHSIPQTQMALGQSAPGMQMVQSPMFPPQPMAVQPPLPGQPQMAWQPSSSGMPMAYGQPQPTTPFMPPNGGMMAQSMTPMMGVPFGLGMGGEVITSPATPGSASSAASTLPVPTPDPAFSNSSNGQNSGGVPATSVSQSMVIEPASTDSPPIIEAF